MSQGTRRGDDRHVSRSTVAGPPSALSPPTRQHVAVPASMLGGPCVLRGERVRQPSVLLIFTRRTGACAAPTTRTAKHSEHSKKGKPTTGIRTTVHMTQEYLGHDEG